MVSERTNLTFKARLGIANMKTSFTLMTSVKCFLRLASSLLRQCTRSKKKTLHLTARGSTSSGTIEYVVGGIVTSVIDEGCMS
jgi:hypothetical protein